MQDKMRTSGNSKPTKGVSNTIMRMAERIDHEETKVINGAQCAPAR